MSATSDNSDSVKSAQESANFHVKTVRRCDNLLKNIDQEIEDIKEKDMQEVKQEKELGKSKEIQLDKKEAEDLQEAFEDIKAAKRDLDDALKLLTDSEFFKTIAGYLTEMASHRGLDEELIDEIETELEKNLGKEPSRERMKDVGEKANRLEGELIDARQKIKTAVKEDLLEVEEIEYKEIRAEDSTRLKMEEKAEYKEVEDVLQKISKLTHFKASKQDLVEGSTNNEGALDKTIGVIHLTSKLAELEVKN